MTVVIKGLQKWEVIGLKASYRENVTVLPTEHGRLIDADAMLVGLDRYYHPVAQAANKMPTIIEAEVSE